MENNEVYYGKPLDYDPDFNGPKKQRSSTDVICLYIFIGFLLIWFSIGIYALVTGNPEVYINNFNTTDISCSDDKPYILYIDIAKCKSISIFGCNSEKVCLQNCPDQKFLFTNAVDDYQKVFCADNIKPQNNDEAQKFIEANKCSLYYFPSEQIEKICVPAEYNYTDMYKDKQLQDKNITYKVIDEAVKNLKINIGFDEMISQIVQDLSHAWPIMLGALAIAVVATIVYILMMRWIAGVMVWACLGTVAVLLIACVIISVKQYIDFDELYPNTLPENRDSQRLSSIIVAVILSVLLIAFVVIFIFLRKKIFLAIALIKESSKAIGDVISSLFFPIIPSVVQLGLFVFGLCIATYLSSIGEKYYTLTNFNTTDCICTKSAANYTNGGECLPEIFANDCHDVYGKICDGVLCTYSGLKQSPLIIVFHAINVVAMYWVLFFMTAFMEMVLAGTFATWYWTMPKSQLQFWIVTKSLGRTMRYHLGTIAFGSFIITVVRLIRMLLDGIQQQLRQSENAVALVLVSCCKCLFSLLESVLKFITRNAYIVCSIHGDNFCTSTKKATSLVIRNLTRVFVLDNVTDFLLFLSKFLITLGIGCITYTMLKYIPSYQFQQMWLPILIMVIASYLIATVFFNVYSMAIDTMFICYLEDIERNDGSPDKPYFMSSKLREILEKQD